jgi:hypothetical protein
LKTARTKKHIEKGKKKEKKKEEGLMEKKHIDSTIQVLAHYTLQERLKGQPPHTQVFCSDVFLVAQHFA